MKTLFRITLVTTAATVLLIFIGGLVRVSGSGLGCPDWPHCYGGWHPPLSQLALQKATLPEGVLPQDVNLTLAWIEYLNRLFGVLVGMLMIATVVAAWRQRRQYRGVFGAAVSCLLLTIANGGLGAVVVRTELKPILVSAHLLLALVIVSLLEYILFRLLSGTSVPLLPVGGWQRLRRALAGAWLLFLGQFILGAILREGLEHLLDDFPLMAGLLRLHHVGAIWPVHAGLGVISAGVFFAVVQSAASRPELPRALVRALWCIMALIMLQVVAGFSFSRIGLQPLVQVFHLWVGSMILLAIFFAYLCAGLPAADGVIRRAVSGPALAGFVLFNLLVAASAAAVVATAQASRSLPEIQSVTDFTFTDQTGTSFTRADLNGRFHVLDLVFTNCPELCPRMSGHMQRLYQRYAADDSLHFISLSVDPERDSQEVLAAYAKSKGVHDDRWRFLRGELDAVKKFSREGLLLNDDFPQAHSIKFVLIDRRGVIRGYYNGLLKDDIDRLERDLATLAQTPGE